MTGSARSERQASLDAVPRSARPRRRRRERDASEFFGALARLLRAAGARAADSDPEDLAVLMGLRTSLDEAIVSAIAGVRASGATWTEIGALTNTTKQAAFARWGPRVAEHESSNRDGLLCH